MKPCIVNFSHGGLYPILQQVLVRTLQEQRFEGDVVLYRTFDEIDSPTQEESPYEFKPRSIKKVWVDGHNLILWLDAAIAAIRDLRPIFEHIEREGYIFFTGNTNCRTWTNDNCLAGMNVSRTEAEKIPMIHACCMGLNMESPTAKQFFLEWSQCAEDGLFIGTKVNLGGRDSPDPICCGHRWDQSVASILIHRMGMRIMPDHNPLFSLAHSYRLFEPPDNIPVPKNTRLIRYYGLRLE